MTGNIWVLVEHWRGEVTEVTYETLALGRELAAAAGSPLEAVLLGADCAALASHLGAADRVLYAQHPCLAEPAQDAYAEALGQLAAARRPSAVLIPLTNITLGIGTLLGARLNAPSVNFCKDIRTEDRGFAAVCVLYGGKMEATVAVRESPAIFGVWPGARPVDEGKKHGAPEVESISLDLPESFPVRFLRYIEPETGEVDISQQDVLVAVGRGIQDKQNLELAEELASLLGGAVCGSRPVIDQGWLPLSRQVGKSGANVKAKLYIAAGISGAPEHVEGIRRAGLIVAVNTDPQAPIFSAAHYGVVNDALEFLPALTEAVRRRKAGA